MAKDTFAMPPTRNKALLIKFEIWNRVGQRLQDGRLTGEFPSREQAA